jgi:glycosyltransferase involved in cell wall biosynthesis
MVRALESVRPDLDVRLQLAGPVFPPSLLPEMQSLPGWRSVTHLGVLDRPGVQDLLARARLGLVLLLAEPIHVTSMPVKLFEYMAAGIPVVASDFPLWRKIVESARCGIVVNPLDSAAVAQAIGYLLDNPREAAAMGLRGRRAVVTHYNWEAEAKKLISCYEALAAGSALTESRCKPCEARSAA